MYMYIMCVYMYHPDHATPTTVCVCVCTQYSIPGIMTEKILWLMWPIWFVYVACENLSGVKSLNHCGVKKV